MEDEEAKSLIQELISFATSDDRIYTHFRKKYDALFGDNRAIIHRGRPFVRDKYPGVMIITTIAGSSLTA